MATFKVWVDPRKQRRDGLWQVYIRVTHNRKIGLIKTDKVVSEKGLNGRKEVVDPYVLQSCNKRIVEYADALNRHETERWTVQEVVAYLKCGCEDVSFSEYAQQHIARMIDNGQLRTSRNYKWAVQHLERFVGTTKLMFSTLTSHLLTEWVKSMEQTSRAKEMYPVIIRQIWKSACQELNDEERGVVRIKHNPWPKVRIPQSDRPSKLAITPEACREFFSAALPDSPFKSPLPELGRDVAMMVLCLGGINTVDLYNLRKADCTGGIIRYQRAKTKKFRADGAYMEMRVPAILVPLMEKYREPDETVPWLLNFHSRHSTSDSFCANVNIGIKKICESMGMSKEDWYCVYTFRHTWGTIAQIDCGASIAEVAFGMNHSAGHRVTRGYLKLSFEPAWTLNEKVVDLVFFTDKQSRREPEAQAQEAFRFSAKHLLRGTVYFRGRTLGVVEDIGFNNVDEVLATLRPFIPDDVPLHSIVHFKIENLDKGQTVIYERQRGKGC